TVVPRLAGETSFPTLPTRHERDRSRTPMAVHRLAKASSMAAIRNEVWPSNEPPAPLCTDRRTIGVQLTIDNNRPMTMNASANDFFKAGCAGFSRKLEPSFAIQGRGRRARGAARAIHAGYDARPAVGRNPIRGSIVRRHGQCRRALFPFVENELNLLAFREGLESFAFDVPVMDEYVGTVFPFYESEPLPVVKPFDGSLHSGRHTPSSGGSKLPWSCCGAPAPEGGLRAAYSSRRAQIGKTSIRCGIAG